MVDNLGSPSWRQERVVAQGLVRQVRNQARLHQGLTWGLAIVIPSEADTHCSSRL